MTKTVPIMLPNTTAFHFGSSVVCAKLTYVANPPMGRVLAPDPTREYTVDSPRLLVEATRRLF